jgi:hypothetical protein
VSEKFKAGDRVKVANPKHKDAGKAGVVMYSHEAHEKSDSRFVVAVRFDGRSLDAGVPEADLAKE